MLTALNAYGGLSAAELLKLFAANSSSSSTSSSSSSTSTSTSQSASAGVSVSSTNDPANSIKAILAQAQIEQGQSKSSAGGSANSANAQAAYVAQTSEGLSATSTIDAAASDVQTLLGATPLLSSLDAGAEAYSAARGIANWASLAVVTASGAASITTANVNGDTDQFGSGNMALVSTDALDIYQFELTQAQQEQANPSGSASVASTPSASDLNVSTGNTQAEQTALRLSIAVTNMAGDDDKQLINAQVATQAQELVSAFEKNTLGSGVASGTGFSYAEKYGMGATVNITGIEVSSSDTPSQVEGSSIAAYQNLANESATFAEKGDSGSDYGDEYFTFIIPAGAS